MPIFTSFEALPLCTCAAQQQELPRGARPQLASLEPEHCHLINYDDDVDEDDDDDDDDDEDLYIIGAVCLSVCGSQK